MKKLLNNKRSHHQQFLKFDLKMKLSILFMLVIFFNLHANTAYSQKTKVSLNLKDVSVNQLIDEIESQTEFRFIYKVKDVNLNRIVSINVEKESMNNILNDVFKKTNTTYNIVDRQIILVEKTIVKPTNDVPNTSIALANEVELWKLTGTVLDNSGQPLPGATVFEKGTDKGTQTDFDGNFTLDVSNQNATIVVSFMGYITKEISLNGKSILNIALQEDTASLDEIVLVGYGTQKKALVTGASVQVNGDDLVKMSTDNALKALQGQTPGVQITATSGQPGESMKVVIRGVGSTGGSQPLFVVDGIITSDISYLNNSDIESIVVLKDAASAAIYGSQASNGVVLVSTKKGKTGTAASITFDQYYGIQKVPNKIDLLNGSEYATMLNEAAVNSGKSPYFTNDEIANMGEGTNWMNEMFVENAPTENYAFGASGGSEKSIYSTSLSYIQQDGVVGGKDLSSYERYNFRFNSEHKLYNDILVIGENFSLAFINKNGIGVGNQYNNSLRGAFSVTPLLPMYDANGEFYDTTNNNEPWLSGVANPYGNMVYNNQNETKDQKLVGNFYAQVEPIENLTFRTSIGLDNYAGENHSYSPIYQLSVYAFRTYNSVSQSSSKGNTFTWDNLATYSFDFNENHFFETMLGTSYRTYSGSWLTANNADVVFDDLEHAWLDNTTNSDGTLMNVGGGKSENKLMSYFGRLNYNYKDTYLLNATFRADGSSNFAPENQWGYFPSVSAGWIATNENFLNDSKKVNFLKLRASWGQVGNQNIRAFQYLSPIKTSTTNYIFGNDEGVLTPGAYPNRLSNPDLKWETSEQFDIGFDSRLFNNTLNMTFDWYQKTNKDWLIVAPVLATAGADAPYINGGNVVNTGVELSLQYQNNIGEFNFAVAVNGAYNKNEVGVIPTADGIIHGETNQLYDNAPEFYRAENGYPLGYFWGLKTGGVFQTQQQINEYTFEGSPIQPNAAPGDIIYQDLNKDGEITDADKTMIGDPNPDYTFGISISGDYKAFDFNIFANGVAGNQLVQSYRNQSNAYGNYTSAILDRWHGVGSSNTVPRVTEDNRNFTHFSDLYIQDGSFFRLSNITVGFDLAKYYSGKKFFASKFRFYISVLNLHTFTKYDGMDPEVGFGTSGFASGIDIGYYPNPRTFMTGLNIKI